MGVAQTGMSAPQDQDSSAASQAAGAKLRGCLSGSAGNYTLTDNNGTIYHLVGGGAQLSGSVGHEVEISGTPDAQRSGATDDAASNTATSFQVTGAREVGTVCEHGSSTGTTGTQSQPMSERPPMTDHQPKGAPGEGAPPPEPHTMAMLQQPGTTDSSGMGSQSSNPAAASPSTSETQTQQNGSMANTPVTSQTPAEPPSATGTNSQLGSGTTTPSAVSTQPAQTGTVATPQGAATTGTAGGTTATTDVNANSGATTSPNTASPQNDQNKPLYERQATDVPWASHSGATTTTTTTSPDGSSSTTTTTTPQAEPHR